jgi:hypothetical protein
VLLEQGGSARADDSAQDERDDDRIVEMADDRDEVRDEVERRREVADQREEEQLLAPRNASIRTQPAQEDNAVRHEPEQGSGFLPAPSEEERGGE